METYNEKQIKLNREINEMRENAHQQFNNKRIELARLKEETGHVFEQEKKRLMTQLSDLLKERYQMRADGYTNTHKAMQDSFLTENRIHEMQAANRMAFFDKLRDIARQNNDNLEQYRLEKLKIATIKSDRLLQIEREQKELLFLKNEETEN